METETTPAFDGLACTACGSRAPATARRCVDCGGALEPTYDLDAVEAVGERDAPGQWRYADLLPFDPADAVTMGEGDTPLVDCPTLADELGVERVLIKDEGRNPTGALADRGASLAVTAAAAAGADDLALASTGDGAQAVAAYAARAGLASHAFLPSRSGFLRKAMVNVHGGDMRVVEGRLPDARAAYGATLDEKGWYPAGAFETPYRHEGLKTLVYEVCDELGAAPDAFVYPTGHGAGLHAAGRAVRELRELGRIERAPRLYAAQAEGCAPVVRAVESAGDRVEPWERPDTICGAIEVPDPAGGDLAVSAVEATGGGAVATDDEAILESAAVVASETGVEMGAAAAAAASGAWELADGGAFDGGETVVLCNTAAGNKDGDVLRNHLVRRGI